MQGSYKWIACMVSVIVNSESNTDVAHVYLIESIEHLRLQSHILRTLYAAILKYIAVSL